MTAKPQFVCNDNRDLPGHRTVVDQLRPKALKKKIAGKIALRHAACAAYMIEDVEEPETPEETSGRHVPLRSRETILGRRYEVARY